MPTDPSGRSSRTALRSSARGGEKCLQRTQLGGERSARSTRPELEELRRGRPLRNQILWHGTQETISLRGPPPTTGTARPPVSNASPNMRRRLSDTSSRSNGTAPRWEDRKTARASRNNDFPAGGRRMEDRPPARRSDYLSASGGVDRRPVGLADGFVEIPAGDGNAVQHDPGGAALKPGGSGSSRASGRPRRHRLAPRPLV